MEVDNKEHAKPREPLAELAPVGSSIAVAAEQPMGGADEPVSDTDDEGEGTFCTPHASQHVNHKN